MILPKLLNIRTMKIEVSITTLFFLILCSITIAQEKRIVITEVLNVRTGEGTDYDAIEQVKEGDTLIAFESEGTWTKIELASGETGYVSSEFLSPPLIDTNSSDLERQKSNSWFGTIFVIVAIVIILGAAKKTLFSKSISKNTQSKSDTQKSNETNLKDDNIYICKHCGTKDKNLNSLTFHFCHRSPTGKHQPLEGGIQEIYSCKHCGIKNKNLNSLTFQSCHRSPTGKHQPLF